MIVSLYRKQWICEWHMCDDCHKSRNWFNPHCRTQRKCLFLCQGICNEIECECGWKVQWLPSNMITVLTEAAQGFSCPETVTNVKQKEEVTCSGVGVLLDYLLFTWQTTHIWQHAMSWCVVVIVDASKCSCSKLQQISQNVFLWWFKLGFDLVRIAG